MVSEYGLAFLKELSKYDHPVDYWTVVRGIEEPSIPMSFETYLIRYLIRPGYVVKYTAPYVQKSWLYLTKKGLLLADPKRAKRQIRDRIRGRINGIIRSNSIWRAYTGYRQSKYAIQSDHRYYNDILMLLELLPEGMNTIFHAATTTFANAYLRYYNDPEDKIVVQLAREQLEFHVPREFIEKHLRNKIVRALRSEIRSRMEFGAYNRDTPELPLDLMELLTYYGEDPTEPVQQGIKAFQKKRERYEDAERRFRESFTSKYPLYAEAPDFFKRCIKCGAHIDHPGVVQKAYKLYLDSGIQSGVLCYRCYAETQ